MSDTYAAAWKTIRDTNVFIRESQEARAYAFPHTFAPDGALKELHPCRYMQVMHMHYAFRKSSENLILELVERDPFMDNEVSSRCKVGEAFLVDFSWNEYETLRIHVVAIWKNHHRVTEHYQVIDMGVSGVGLTIPQRAWDNWRQFNKHPVEGIPVDKRIIYMLIGDRSQIGNMALEEFSRLKCDQVEALMFKLEAGMMLVRPSIEEAGLDEGPVPTISTPPSVIELTNSSSSSGSGSKDPEKKEGEAVVNLPETGARPKVTRTGLRSGAAPSTSGAKKPKRKESDPPSADTRVWMGPDGKPFPKEIANNLEKLFTECVYGSPERYELEESLQYEDDDFSVNDSGKETSLCDISGVSSFQRESTSSSSTDWAGPGPIPMDDSVEVFLSKKVNESQIVTVSDDSIPSVDGGQTNGDTAMDF